VSDSTFSLCTAVLELMLGLGTVPLVNAAADDGCPDPPCSTAKSADASTLEEIVVTGSHIRGVEAAGSKLIVIGRDQIDASGYGRIEDVLATVTQNVNRSNQAVAFGPGDQSQVDNLNRGAEVQLRGLGLGTTLTLVNGQRQGASGFQGTFTDISTIPLSAVERIEILPEGAAALYGSDAIGGVVNIILRKNFTGFETRVRASTAGGDGNERTLAQLWGHTWSGGHILLGFEYNDSAALACSARAYCAANGDFRRFGGGDLRSAGGSPGTILNPDTLVPIAAIPHGQDGTRLTAAQLIPGAANYTDNVSNNDILPQQTMRSAFLSGSHQITDHWELSVDGQYSSRTFKSTFPQYANNVLVPATNAFNYLGGPVRVAYDFTPDIGPVVDSGPTTTFVVSPAVKGVLSGGWQLNLSGSYSKSTTEFIEANNLNDDSVLDAGLNSSDPTTALNLFGDGSHSSAAALANLHSQISTFRALDLFTTASANVIADGPLVIGPAGAIRLAVGSGFRKEHSVGLNIAFGMENRSRQVAAGFFELAAPILAARPGSKVDRLDLSLAGRYERYSDVGTTFNPKVGLSWRPWNLIKLRGTWGTSFRAPPFFWTNPDQFRDTVIQPVDDPKSQSLTGQSRALLLFGHVPDLQPETARAWTVGVDFAPPEEQNYSLSLSYFDIDYRGKVEPPGPYAAAFLTREAEFASLITRNPTQAQIDAVCKKPPLSGGDCNQRIDAILDNRARNLARVDTRGVDAALDYSFDSSNGKWTLGVNGTYTFDQKHQITPTAPVFDFVNTVGNPLKLRLVGHLSWSLKGWTVQTTMNHTGSYRDPDSVLASRVNSWTTVDVNVGYRAEGGRGWLANTQFNLGINNALDQRPPFVNQFSFDTSTFGYDPANASLIGRQVSLQVVKRWGQ
jgi:iron complex outermembrane recepter protein